MKMDYDKELEVAETAARSAGKILMAMFGKNMKRNLKGTMGDFATEADMASEKEMIRIIKSKFPEHSILAEESGESGSSDYRWIIDPLDGTHNYYYGIPIFGTMIALEFRNEIIVTVIYLPCINELYTAVKGKGAFLNGKRIHVSRRKNNFMYAYSGMYTYNENGASRKLFEAIAPKFSPFVRIFFCAAFTQSLIAKGAVDGVITFDRHFWDMAPGILLIEEAGGKVTDVNGAKWTNKTRFHHV